MYWVVRLCPLCACQDLCRWWVGPLENWLFSGAHLGLEAHATTGFIIPENYYQHYDDFALNSCKDPTDLWEFSDGLWTILNVWYMMPMFDVWEGSGRFGEGTITPNIGLSIFAVIIKWHYLINSPFLPNNGNVSVPVNKTYTTETIVLRHIFKVSEVIRTHYW